MYELFKIVSVIAIILWALRDKIDEPRNVKYCCNKENKTEVKSSLIEVPSDDDTPAPRPFIADESSTIDMPAAESIIESFTFNAPSDNDTPAPQPFVADETPVIELSIVELSTVEQSTDELSTVELSTVELSTVELSTVELSTDELSTIVDIPAAESTVDMPDDELSTIDDDELSTIVDDEPEEVVSIEDLYGDYTDLLMPSIMLRLSNNTSINNTFVLRNNCFGVVHASI